MLITIEFVSYFCVCSIPGGAQGTQAGAWPSGWQPAQSRRVAMRWSSKPLPTQPFCNSRDRKKEVLPWLQAFRAEAQVAILEHWVWVWWHVYCAPPALLIGFYRCALEQPVLHPWALLCRKHFPRNSGPVVLACCLPGGRQAVPSWLLTVPFLNSPQFWNSGFVIVKHRVASQHTKRGERCAGNRLKLLSLLLFSQPPFPAFWWEDLPVILLLWGCVYSFVHCHS